MTDTTGVGDSAATNWITSIISGGASVHLIGGGDTIGYADTASDVDTKSDASQSIAEADWTISTPGDFSGVATLENDNLIDFGSQDIGTVNDVVVKNDSDGSYWILADEPNNPNLTGEEVTIPAGTTFYELGNPT